MLNEILPFRLDLNTVAIAGATLWSLALYLGFSPVSEWVTEQLNVWFNFAEQFMYTSKSEFEKTRQARESQNAFYASVFSIIPCLIIGTLCYWIIEVSLGDSWGISTGILACMSCGVYELGRRDSENS
jgi:small-conductance mechanosensitive channel